MQNVYIPAFYLGVCEELEKISRCWSGYEPVPGKKPYSDDSCRPKGSGKREKKEKKADLQTSVPGETPEGLLSRVRNGKANFPKLLENAQQHKWNIPGVPFSNSVVHGFLNANKDNPEAIRSKILSQPDERLISMIQKNPDAFRGVQNQQAPAPAPVQPGQPVQAAPATAQPPSKVAFDIDGMPVNENILPSIANQAKWKYAKHKGALKLSDGNLVYSFGMPDEYPAEDARVSRLDDDNILNFDKDALSKGTAQIHRSSPDNIYMTLANGAENPTFMLQHEEGKNWRYSPAKKFLEKLKRMGAAGESTETLPVDSKALLDGAADHLKEATYLPFMGEGIFHSPEEAADWLKDKYHMVSDAASRFTKARAEAPVTSMLGGYAIAHGIGAARDMMDPSREEKRKTDPHERLKRELVPVAAGVLPTLASMAINAK